MKLYEINQELLNCVKLDDGNSVNEETGEVIDAEAIKKLQMERSEKIENIALWIKNELAEAEAIKVEKNKLGNRQKAHENKAQSLKEYLMFNVTEPKFETSKVCLSHRKSTSVDVVDRFKIPKKYLKEVEPTIDKMTIKKDLKNGIEIPGAALKETNLLIIK